LPSQTHGKKDIAANMMKKLDRNINSQPLTSGIKHWGLSGYSSLLPRIKFVVTRQESNPQSPTISHPQPLSATPRDTKLLTLEKNLLLPSLGYKT